LSSAILYVAIVAIWAGVLIPRWLRRDSSASEAAVEDVTSDPAVSDDSAGAQAGPGRRGREEDAPRARVAPRVRAGAPVDSWPVESRPVDAGRAAAAAARARAPRDEEHARVLSARRRLLGLLLTLTAGSMALEVTRMAAWWVVVPPTVMLLGYLGLLRAAAKVDAERRQLARTRLADEAAPAPVTAPAPVSVPVAAPDAEIIEIPVTAAVTVQNDEECYDQYADAKLRAVGDLAAACDLQDLGPAEGDVRVEGEPLAWHEPQVRVAAG
jgi:hypothetical protein